MHVAVAPACNVQCHYCNRKYDCANESRPGVVSERLRPEDAVRKVLAVAAEIPELSVVGIAGPGDALANPTPRSRPSRACGAPRRTCGSASPRTASRCPSMERLARAGVRHVTVTVNMIDPAVGERIYPWVLRGGRKLRGAEGARVLSAQQLDGIVGSPRGAFVKVNAVVIPGVNDAHLPDVVRAVRSAGAFIVNLVPLISAPEHGTHFGRTGQRGPTPDELERVQAACELDARSCATAVSAATRWAGSEDRFAEFTVASLPPGPIQDAREVRAARAGRSRASARGPRPIATPRCAESPLFRRRSPPASRSRRAAAARWTSTSATRASCSCTT